MSKWSTCNNCNSGEQLENQQSFEIEGEHRERGDCLKCGLRHEFREDTSAPGEPVMFVRDKRYPIPAADDDPSDRTVIPPPE